MPEDNSRLVYSTDGGRVRPSGTRRPEPARNAPRDPDDGFVRVRRETKGRGGKTVTAISGLSGGALELDRLLKVFKRHCGTGGSRDGGILVIQGDHRERLHRKLEEMGYKVKLAGG